MKTFHLDALSVRIFDTPSALAEDAAQSARICLQQAVARQGSAAVILASAASQVEFLASLTARDGVAWDKITVFHMDEYLGLSGEHPASFRRFLREHVVTQVHPKAFHGLEGDAPEPLKEIARYTALLQAQPIDLCCLGIGENGHIAFNDPPVADFEDPQTVKLVQLDLKCRQQQVGEGHFAGLESVPKYAFTLTIPALCRARKLICVAPERRKAEAVRHALEGSISPACPASILRRQPHATLYLDTQSASLLSPAS
jgi:glucosamine-6-phosphate deaminase